jgi:branched-chain amino acid transport system substrate-binding protein
MVLNRTMARSKRTSIALSLVGVAALVAACSSSGSKSTAGGSTGPATSTTGSSAAPATSGGSAPTKGNVAVAVIADMTGSFGPFQGANAMLAYIDHVNDNGGIDGYKVVPTVYDSASTPAGASQAVRRALAAHPAAVLTAAIGIPSALGTLASSGLPVGGDGFVPGWTGHPNLFSIIGDVGGHNSDAWLQALKSAKATKIAILSSQLETGDANLWKRLAPAAGVSITMTDTSVPPVPSAAEALSIAQRVKSSGANGVIVTGLSGGEEQFQIDLNRLGVHAVVAQSSAFGPSVIKSYGSSVNGMTYLVPWASPYVKDNAGVTQFLADMNKYGYSKEIYDSAAIVHYAEAELILDQGLKAAGSPFDAATAVKALSTVTNFTADGLVSNASYPQFQQVGSACLAATQVVSGQWVSLKNGADPFICGSASVAVS